MMIRRDRRNYMAYYDRGENSNQAVGSMARLCIRAMGEEQPRERLIAVAGGDVQRRGPLGTGAAVGVCAAKEERPGAGAAVGGHLAARSGEKKCLGRHARWWWCRSGDMQRLAGVPSTPQRAERGGWHRAAGSVASSHRSVESSPSPSDVEARALRRDALGALGGCVKGNMCHHNRSMAADIFFEISREYKTGHLAMAHARLFLVALSFSSAVFRVRGRAHAVVVVEVRRILFSSARTRTQV